MKSIILFTIILPAFAFGQTINNTSSSKRTNIYNDAIIRFIEINKKWIGDTLFLQKEDNDIDSLIKKHVKTPISYLDFNQIGSKAKNQGSFTYYKLSSLEFRQNWFWIDFITLIAEVKGSELIISNGGTGFLSYSYDCSNKVFQFFKYSSNGY